MTRNNDDEEKVAELVSLRWSETSGVDHSANEEEGWLVMKQANQNTEELALESRQFEQELEQLLKEEEVAEKNAGKLIALLEEIDNYIEEAPREIKDAAKKLLDYLKQEYGGYGYPEAYGYGYPEPNGYGYPGPGKDEKGPSRKDVIGLLRRLMVRTRGKKQDDERYPPPYMKKLEEAWPEFVKKVAEIVKSSAAVKDKQLAINEALLELKRTIE